MMNDEFSFLFPFLLVMWVVQSILHWLGKSSTGWRQTIPIAIISLLISIIPVAGISPARWLISLNANFSIMLTAILFTKVWEKATGKILFDRETLSSFWIFGAVMGLLLYPMALGLGPYDPYVLGWGFSPLFAAIMGLTIFLLLKRKPLGIALILCILAYQLRLMESINYWDYLIDPFYVIISYVYLIQARGAWTS